MKVKKFNLDIYLVLLLAFVLAGVFYYFQNGLKNVSNVRANRINSAQGAIETSLGRVASVSASASPSATPSLSIPKNYGRSVSVPILTYHYIGNNPNPADKARDNLAVVPDRFDEEMGILQKKGYTPISLDTMYSALKGNSSLPSKPIILTFDDGYIDFYTTAYPILKKYNFHATSFIPTGLMGQGYYMSWAQIKEIDSSGLISFQAHSVNHPNLTALNSDQLKYQLSESKKRLEAELSKPVNFMAYPYGISNENTWNAAQGAGYVGALGTYAGSIESEGNLFDMPRLKVAGGWTTEDFSKRF